MNFVGSVPSQTAEAIASGKRPASPIARMIRTPVRSPCLAPMLPCPVIRRRLLRYSAFTGGQLERANRGHHFAPSIAPATDLPFFQRVRCAPPLFGAFRSMILVVLFPHAIARSPPGHVRQMQRQADRR